MKVSGKAWRALTSAERMSILFGAYIKTRQRWTKKKAPAATEAAE